MKRLKAHGTKEWNGGWRRRVGRVARSLNRAIEQGFRRTEGRDVEEQLEGWDVEEQLEEGAPAATADAG